jgi:hypothetical protein
MSLLNVVMVFATGVATDASTAVFGADYSLISFSVESGTKCTSTSCPGSFYTAIATAWANIGYVTHADVLRFLSTTHFGKWAILLYIAAAVGGLIGVATNSPMRNYTWFFIGPALFSFLVGTTMKVQGVNWVVANRAAEDMSEVWKNAEAGLANTRLVKDGLLKINGKYGPQAQYEVAMPMVFLDELFSATANILIEWTGIGRQVDNGGGESNLSSRKKSGKDAWWLVSNLKWSYLENLTANTIRNPDIRDAFVTFLASECGDVFKQGIDSANYIAATQARGPSSIETVFNDNDKKDYLNMQILLGGTSISTPRSLARVFKEKVNRGEKGSFLQFSPSLKSEPQKYGRTYGIVCSEYLWTIIQALRFEAGSAYYQLIRSAPDGFEEEGFVETLFYGWDVREQIGQDTDLEKQRAFLKHLILAYIIRNELIAAPQITTVDQRYAPAEQSRSYSEANIRAYGSKGKFIEIYNAAIMMPYLQGILAYCLIVAYPIACMMVILPGHYKAFFTWVSFFAWVKLWDVGFAMVHVLERSVWAMLGNNSYMGAKARTLVEVAKNTGTIGVSVRQGVPPSQLEPLTAVCSMRAGGDSTACAGQAIDQSMKNALELFDQMLVVGANIDLDLSNGWYIYIMSALYLAVPAVTGQLVLGAKAGSAGLIKDAFSGVGNDGAQAAKTGAQHKDVNALTSNKGSIGQMAYAKALRKGTGADGQSPSLAMQGVEAGNRAMRENMAGAKVGLAAGDRAAMADVAGKTLGSLDRGGVLLNTGGGGGGGGASGFGVAAAKVAYGRRSDNMGVAASAQGRMAAYEEKGRGYVAQGHNTMADRIGAGADFDAQSAAWEARNEFASHASAMAGIAGMNAGSLSPGEKPSHNATAMGMSGMLDGYNKDGTANPARSYSDALSYAGEGFVHEANGLFSTPRAPLITRDGQMGFPTKDGVTLGGGGSGAAASNSVYGTWDDAGGSLTAAGVLEKAVEEGTNLRANTGYDKAGEWGNAAANYAKDWYQSNDGKLSQQVGSVNRVDSQGVIQKTDAIPSPPQLPGSIGGFAVPGAQTVNDAGKAFTDKLNGK